jgi:hypothetical protein
MAHGGEWVLQPKWDGFRLNSSLLRLSLHRAAPIVSDSGKR